MTMHAWLVGIGESLPIEGAGYRRWRTGMLAEELVRRGHRVTWWTSTFNHFTKRYIAGPGESVAVADGLTLRFLHGRPYSTNVSFGRLRNHGELAADFSWRAATEEPPDFVFSSFPPIELCDAAVRYSRIRGLVSVVDVNDLWPDEMLARVPTIARGLARLAVVPMQRRVSRTMQDATSIIGISRTYLEWARRKCDRPQSAPDGVHVLGYPAMPAARAKVPSTPWLLDPRLRCRRVFLFVGTFVGNIDLSTVLEAAHMIRQRNDIHFLLVGSGENEMSWRRLAAGLDNVSFTGWATREQIAEAAKLAYAGLAAYRPGALMSLPNKIFEYLAAGLPILSSLGGEARELIETYAVGESYRAGDPASLAGCVSRLVGEPACRELLAGNARRVFAEKFAAEVVYNRLASHLEDVVQARKCSP